MSEQEIAGRVHGTDGKTYPRDYAANRAAIRAAIEADPGATNTDIAKRLATSRDTVSSVRKIVDGAARIAANFGFVPLAKIRVGVRHRKDYGDIDALAASIAEVGLLQPIVVTPEFELIAGERRLLALDSLGWRDVPVRVLSLEAVILGEYAENEFRKNFTVSERVAIGLAIEAQIGKRQGARTDIERGELPPNLAEVDGGREFRDVAAERAGFGGRENYRKAKEVVTQGAPELVEAMDEGRASIHAAAAIATVPQEEQRDIVARGEAEILKAAKEIRSRQTEARREERTEALAAIARENAPLGALAARFPILYIDPPWQYEYSKTESRAIENHYPTMAVAELMRLDVADVATHDAVLFMWATSPKLAEALQLLEAWGFEYRTCAVWIKNRIGMGYYFRQQHELLLVATHGTPPTPKPEDRVSSVLSCDVGEHSAKPEEFAVAIECMYPTLPKVELFARAPRDGWAVWGNQASGVEK